MAMTSKVKDELSRLVVTKPCCRRAEVAALLRFAGGLHIISGRIVIEAELDHAATARRLRTAIGEVYGHGSEIIVVSGGNLRRGSRYVIRVVRDGESLARQTGLPRDEAYREMAETIGRIMIARTMETNAIDDPRALLASANNGIQPK